MTGESQARRPRSISTGTGSPALEDRVADLEGRLMRVESRRPSMEHARGWFGQIMPAEASDHFRTAMREQLLGMRALVDHWIRRMESEPQSTSERKQIRID
jgi:hypothetical protein